MISIKGNLNGVKEMQKRLTDIAKETPARVEKALYAEMQIEATEMKRRTPVDTRPNAPHPGNLRNSIHVEKPETHGKTTTCVVATGPEAPYAIYVHENPDAHHPVGQWKFMESVLSESRPHMKARLAARLRFK